MHATDLKLNTPGGIFSLRVAGVLLRGEQILVQRVTGASSYALPGGHVLFGESSDQALVREFMEEMGVAVRVERPLFLQENFWHMQQTPCHQVCTYFLLSLSPGAQLPQGSFAALDPEDIRPDMLKFHWVNLCNLSNVDFHPAFLQQALAHPLPMHMQHFITRSDGPFVSFDPIAK